MLNAAVLSPSQVFDFHLQVFLRAGVPLEGARTAASVRLESLLRQPAGFDVFALERLRNTVRRLQGGGINPTPHVQIIRQRGCFALLDGDNGLGAVVGTQAMAQCLHRAREHGLGLVGVRNSTTLGMLATYAMQALEHQAIGFATTNTELKIGLPAWGGLTPALGNNPFAVAIPGGQGPALVLDMSVIATAPQTSSTAQQEATRTPLGSTFLSRPIIGAHKGYGLALVLEVLSGVLTGAGFGQAHAPERLQTAAAPYDLGHLFAVLDPALFMPLETFTARLDQLRQEIRQGQRAPGVDRLLLPGELEDERRTARWREGITLDPDMPEVLRQFCDTLGIDFPLVTR